MSYFLSVQLCFPAAEILKIVRVFKFGLALTVRMCFEPSPNHCIYYGVTYEAIWKVRLLYIYIYLRQEESIVEGSTCTILSMTPSFQDKRVIRVMWWSSPVWASFSWYLLLMSSTWNKIRNITDFSWSPTNSMVIGLSEDGKLSYQLPCLRLPVTSLLALFGFLKNVVL